VGTGVGKPGYCKICDHPAGQFLNDKVKNNPPDRYGKTGFNSKRAQEFALELGLTFDRATWSEHVEHITHPLITHLKQAQANPVILPKTNQGVLEAIRDIGMRNAADNPDLVTPDHAIKAAGILEQKKLGAESIQIFIAKFMQQAKPEELETDVIVGAWRELPLLEEGSPV
jgi:hypothetical protein